MRLLASESRSIAHVTETKARAPLTKELVFLRAPLHLVVNFLNCLAPDFTSADIEKPCSGGI